MDLIFHYAYVHTHFPFLLCLFEGFAQYILNVIDIQGLDKLGRLILNFFAMFLADANN